MFGFVLYVSYCKKNKELSNAYDHCLGTFGVIYLSTLSDINLLITGVSE